MFLNVFVRISAMIRVNIWCCRSCRLDSMKKFQYKEATQIIKKNIMRGCVMTVWGRNFKANMKMKLNKKIKPSSRVISIYFDKLFRFTLNYFSLWWQSTCCFNQHSFETVNYCEGEQISLSLSHSLADFLGMRLTSLSGWPINTEKGMKNKLKVPRERV